MNQPPNNPGYPASPHQGIPPEAMPGGTIPPGTITGPITGPAEYEFSEEENTSVERAGAWAKGLGLLSFVHTGLQLLNLNPAGLIYHAILGVLFFRGGQSLTEVVETEGNDTQHLLDALDRLGTALWIRSIVVAVVTVFMIVFAAALFLLITS